MILTAAGLLDDVSVALLDTHTLDVSHINQPPLSFFLSLLPILSRTFLKVNSSFNAWYQVHPT